MPVIKFSVPTIKNLPNDGKEYSAEGESGFKIRCCEAPSDKKIFYLIYDAPVQKGEKRKRRRMKLGEFGIITLDEARKLKNRALGTLSFNEDPQQVKEPVVTYIQQAENTNISVISNKSEEPNKNNKTLTVEQGLSLYIEKHFKKRGLKSMKGYQSVYDKLDDKIKNIDILNTPHEYIFKKIEEYIDRIGETGKRRSANVAYQYIKSGFSWLKKKKYVEKHILADLERPFPEADVESDRELKQQEIKAIIDNLRHFGQPYEPYVKFLFLTAKRRMEVANMKWGQINEEEGTWEIPKANLKGRKKKSDIIRLPKQALSILNQIPRSDNCENDYVFTTTNGEKPIAGFSKWLDKLQTISNTKDWSYHDIRRTMGGVLAEEFKVPDIIITHILNHSPKKILGVSSIYIRHEYKEEKAKALQEYADWLDKLIYPNKIDDLMFEEIDLSQK